MGSIKLSPTRYEIGGKVRLVGRFFHLGGHCHLKEREALLKAEASLFFWWQHPIVATSILSARIVARYPLERYSLYTHTALSSVTA
jgi:hypothetical protein